MTAPETNADSLVVAKDFFRYADASGGVDVTVSPDDPSVTYPTARSFYLETTGNVSVVTGAGNTRALVAFPANVLFQCEFSRVTATGALVVFW